MAKKEQLNARVQPAVKEDVEWLQRHFLASTKKTHSQAAVVTLAIKGLKTQIELTQDRATLNEPGVVGLLGARIEHGSQAVIDQIQGGSSETTDPVTLTTIDQKLTRLLAASEVAETKLTNTLDTLYEQGHQITLSFARVIGAIRLLWVILNVLSDDTLDGTQAVYDAAAKDGASGKWQNWIRAFGQATWLHLSKENWEDFSNAVINGSDVHRDEDPLSQR